MVSSSTPGELRLNFLVRVVPQRAVPTGSAGGSIDVRSVCQSLSDMAAIVFLPPVSQAPTVPVVGALLPPLPKPPVEEDVPALPAVPIVVQPPLPPALPGGVEATVPEIPVVKVVP